MVKLEDEHPRVYEHFLAGRHVMPRTDKVWAGVSSDLIIEQTNEVHQNKRRLNQRKGNDRETAGHLGDGTSCILRD